jgi:hypothetical protein
MKHPGTLSMGLLCILFLVIGASSQQNPAAAASIDPVFSTLLSYASGGFSANSVAVADFNGDGKLDLVVANSCKSNIEVCPGATVGVLLGKGNGTFRNVVRYPAGNFAQAVAVGDFNGDGKPDLAVAGLYANKNLPGPGLVTILLNNGNGTFKPGVTYGSGGLLAHSLVVGDFNGDGKLDLAVVNEGSALGSVAILLGNGDGTFQAAVPFACGAASQSVVAGDFNHDNKLDVAVSNIGSISILLGNGDGTLQAPVNLPSTGTALTTGDFNSDGNLDLAVGASNSNKVSVFLGNGNGSFQAPATYATAFPANALAVGDFNGDGTTDLALVHGAFFQDDGAGVLVAKGDGTFRPQQSFAALDTDPSSIAVGDFNGEGKLDMVVSTRCAALVSGACRNGAVVAILGKGDSTFNGPLGYSSRELHIVSPPGDFNSDHNPDLVGISLSVCNGKTCTTGKAGVLLGNAKGNFQKALQVLPVGYNPHSAAIGDFNHDGKLDLAVTADCVSFSSCGNEGIVSVLLGKGNGTFRSPVVYPSGGNGPFSLDVGDFNGDGKLDLVIANFCSTSGTCDNGFFKVLFGNGDGTFQPAVNYSSGGYGSSFVAVGDFNADGKLDVAVGNSCQSVSTCLEGGSVSVVLGNGDGTFRKPFSSPTGASGLGWLTIGDFNGDGKPDIAVASQQFGTQAGVGAVSVFLGKGDGTLRPATLFKSGGDTAFFVATADFNGDGKADLLVGNFDNTALLLGDGKGGCPTVQTYFPPPSTFGDFNNDGKPDLLAGWIFSEFVVRLNVVNAVHSPTTPPANLQAPRGRGQSVAGLQE